MARQGGAWVAAAKPWLAGPWLGARHEDTARLAES
jgi:hypothetical protein